ncbi:MAG: GntR family transcriptional regulator [Bacteroidales bacterium]|nr:GntR family transcriptional regulator [Bacteroidales bacterium]
MEFDNNKAIYLQISDNICSRILSGMLVTGGRIPSVREWGAEIGVNPNTVVRSYEVLTDMGVIYQKRGIGFFVAEDARQRILEAQKRQFLEQELPAFLKKAGLLGVNLSDYIK